MGDIAGAGALAASVGSEHAVVEIDQCVCTGWQQHSVSPPSFFSSRNGSSGFPHHYMACFLVVMQLGTKKPIGEDAGQFNR